MSKSLCHMELVEQRWYINIVLIYSKTCLKRPLNNRHSNCLKTNGSLMKVESIAECSLGAFCNTFDLH